MAHLREWGCLLLVGDEPTEHQQAGSHWVRNEPQLRPASATFSACLPDTSATLHGFPPARHPAAKLASVCLRTYVHAAMHWALLCVCFFLSTLCLWDLCLVLHMVVDHSPGS